MLDNENDSSENSHDPNNGTVANFTYKIINTYPHDAEAFTQGLVFEDGVLYEGTGLKGKSTLRRVILATGEVIQNHDLDPKYFGEGVTVFQDKIIQLTWKDKIGFVYDKDTFELQDSFNYNTEGWGLTHDGSQLIMSDGTDTLYFLDPDNYTVTGQIKVRYNNTPVTMLNELEYINGEIYANVWQTDFIVIISPETGNVTGRINLTGLLGTHDPGNTADVLNGIAYDSENSRLFVTGKYWPKLFEIELVKVM